jgi:hypothetical protein
MNAPPLQSRSLEDSRIPQYALPALRSQHHARRENARGYGTPAVRRGAAVYRQQSRCLRVRVLLFQFPYFLAKGPSHRRISMSSGPINFTFSKRRGHSSMASSNSELGKRPISAPCIQHARRCCFCAIHGIAYNLHQKQPVISDT